MQPASATPPPCRFAHKAPWEPALRPLGSTPPSDRSHHARGGCGGPGGAGQRGFNEGEVGWGGPSEKRCVLASFSKICDAKSSRSCQRCHRSPAHARPVSLGQVRHHDATSVGRGTHSHGGGCEPRGWADWVGWGLGVGTGEGRAGEEWSGGALGQFTTEQRALNKRRQAKPSK